MKSLLLIVIIGCLTFSCGSSRQFNKQKYTNLTGLDNHFSESESNSISANPEPNSTDENLFQEGSASNLNEIKTDEDWGTNQENLENNHEIAQTNNSSENFPPNQAIFEESDSSAQSIISFEPKGNTGIAPENKKTEEEEKMTEIQKLDLLSDWLLVTFLLTIIIAAPIAGPVFLIVSIMYLLKLRKTPKEERSKKHKRSAILAWFGVALLAVVMLLIIAIIYST